MKPWESLGKASMPDGSTLELRHHDGEYVIRADTYDLMSSRRHGSEEAMMALALPKPKPGARVLVGGLGMGYTLRAALDLLPPDGVAVVSELVPAVAEWNRGPLGPLAGNPLDDPRTELRVGNVVDIIRESAEAFDAILLDVDNGPGRLSEAGNFRLYTAVGLKAITGALRTGGAVAVWSDGPAPAFERELRRAGLEPSTHKMKVHGVKQVVFVGRKTPAGQRPATRARSASRARR